LEGLDSRFKVALTERAFIANAVDLLVAKGKTKEEAVQLVSEALTGESFEKALEVAKNIIDKTNALQSGKKVRDSQEAIHRLAMDLVRENLAADDKLTMDEVNDAFEQAYKSAGRDIGHVANNMASEMVNNQSAKLSSRKEESMREKDWKSASAEALMQSAFSNVINPFVGGGTNWMVLSLEHSGVPGLISMLYNRSKQTELDLTTEQGVKNRAKALYRKRNFQASKMRVVVGAAMAFAMYAASQVGDDDDEVTDKLSAWLEENDWAKRMFKKLAPEVLVAMVAMKDGELGTHMAQMMGMKMYDLDPVLKMWKELNKDSGNVAGNLGAAIGQLVSSPFAWRVFVDGNNIMNGLQGNETYKPDYRVSTFTNGLMRAGLAEPLGLRPDMDELPKKKEKGGISPIPKIKPLSKGSFK